MGSMATGDEGETRRCDGYPCVNGRTRAALAMVEGEIGEAVLLGEVKIIGENSENNSVK